MEMAFASVAADADGASIPASTPAPTRPRPAALAVFMNLRLSAGFSALRSISWPTYSYQTPLFLSRDG